MIKRYNLTESKKQKSYKLVGQILHYCIFISKNSFPRNSHTTDNLISRISFHIALLLRIFSQCFFSFFFFSFLRFASLLFSSLLFTSFYFSFLLSFFSFLFCFPSFSEQDSTFFYITKLI